MIINFFLLTLVALLGWMANGYGMIGRNRRWRIAPFWNSAAVGALGFLIAGGATVAASFVGRWWWGPVVLLIAPNLAAILIYSIGERIHDDR